ncbi:MAG: endonuclease III [Bacilli bacterium]
MTKNDVFSTLKTMFPHVGCELNYQSHYELLVSVILSAQTTDKRVNMVTVELFEIYPDLSSLSQADPDVLKRIIGSLGLYQTKSKNLIQMANQVINQFEGKIPNTLEELTTLAGVGRKTANVMLSEGFHIPAMAVDTHVKRVSNRLGLAHSDNPDVVEESLQKVFPRSQWHEAHHLMIHFGRYICKAKKPDCFRCPFECEFREAPFETEKMLH